MKKETLLTSLIIAKTNLRLNQNRVKFFSTLKLTFNSCWCGKYVVGLGELTMLPQQQNQDQPTSLLYCKRLYS